MALQVKKFEFKDSLPVGSMRDSFGKLYNNSPTQRGWAFSNICGLTAIVSATHCFVISEKDTDFFLTEIEIIKNNYSLTVH